MGENIGISIQMLQDTKGQSKRGINNQKFLKVFIVRTPNQFVLNIIQRGYGRMT